MAFLPVLPELAPKPPAHFRIVIAPREPPARTRHDSTMRRSNTPSPGFPV